MSNKKKTKIIKTPEAKESFLKMSFYKDQIEIVRSETFEQFKERLRWAPFGVLLNVYDSYQDLLKNAVEGGCVYNYRGVKGTPEQKANGEFYLILDDRRDWLRDRLLSSFSSMERSRDENDFRADTHYSSLPTLTKNLSDFNL